MYMLDDVALLAIGVVTLSQTRLQEKEGRLLKLVSGARDAGAGALPDRLSRAETARAARERYAVAPMVPSPMHPLPALAAALAAFVALAAGAEPLRVGSKRFTESYILGEILAQSAARAGAAGRAPAGPGQHRHPLRGALSAGPSTPIPSTRARSRARSSRRPRPSTSPGINRRLAPLGLAASVPLGFSNGYALGMRESVAAAKGIASVSDLARHAGLALGPVARVPAAARTAGRGSRPPTRCRRRARAGWTTGSPTRRWRAGQVDVIDIYTTDAKIARFGVRALADDRGFFPRYDAVVLHRLDAACAPPGRLRGVEGARGRARRARR